MKKPLTLLGLFTGIATTLVSLSGCGTAQTASTTTPTTRTSSQQSPSPSPSPSPSQSSSPSSTQSATSPSSSAPSSKTIVTSTSPSKNYTKNPPPPNAGAYSDLILKVNQVTSEGTAASSGRSLSLLRLKVTVTDPTSSMIALSMNDFAVMPSGQTGYVSSWNDYTTKGLTSSNTLFPFPFSPKSPQSYTILTRTGVSVTGDITVQVPNASQYRIVWASSHGKVAAQFTS